MSVFESRRCQSPKPGATTPPELQAQIHDHVTADHVPKRRRASAVTDGLSKSLFDACAAQEKSRVTSALLSRIKHP